MLAWWATKSIVDFGLTPPLFFNFTQIFWTYLIYYCTPTYWEALYAWYVKNRDMIYCKIAVLHDHVAIQTALFCYYADVIRFSRLRFPSTASLLLRQYPVNLYSHSPPPPPAATSAPPLCHIHLYRLFIDTWCPRRCCRDRRTYTGGKNTRTNKQKHILETGVCLVVLNQHAHLAHRHTRTRTHALLKRKEKPLKFQHIAFVMRPAGNHHPSPLVKWAQNCEEKKAVFDRRVQMQGDRISMRPERGNA